MDKRLLRRIIREEISSMSESYRGIGRVYQSLVNTYDRGESVNYVDVRDLESLLGAKHPLVKDLIRIYNSKALLTPNYIRGLKRLVTNEGSVSRVNEGTLLTEGTRAQVGFINRSGLIRSQYVHYDGGLSNMRSSIKDQFRTLKSIKQFISGGGASGVYAGEPIRYYGDMSALSSYGEDVVAYVAKAQRENGVDYVYLYDQKTKTWVYSDGSGKIYKLY